MSVPKGKHHDGTVRNGYTVFSAEGVPRSLETTKFEVQHV